MARPAGGRYRLKDGTIVPSVTTILGSRKNVGGLLHWAWQQGVDGKDYRETRDRAAEAGTLAHNAVEAHIRGLPFEWPLDSDVTQKARIAFGAFREWADQMQLKVTHTETSLVSEQHKFGGTLDGLLLSGRRSVADWKTSNSVHGDYIIQVAAYSILWNENFPDDPVSDEGHLVRFDKNFGDFSHRYWSDLKEAREAFLLLRRIYDIDKTLTARAK